MYNIDVGDTMRKILFKIKKFFLIIFSFLLSLLFDRKTNTYNITNDLEEDKKDKQRSKDFIKNKRDRKEHESKGKIYSHKKEIKDSGYPSIKKDIEKVFFIQKYVDDITFQLKKENSYQELKQILIELEKYKEQVSFLQREMMKSSIQEEEYQEFTSLCDVVNEQIIIDEMKVELDLDKKQKEDRKQEVEMITVEEELKEENQYRNVINYPEENIGEIERNIEVKNQDKQIVINKEEKDAQKEKKELVVQEKEPNCLLGEQIVIKEIPKVVIDSNIKKRDAEEKRQENTSNKNQDIGSYKMKLENIRNMIRNITISKQKKVIKKVSSNIITAGLIFATLSPAIQHTSNNTKKIATVLLINNRLRQSNNLLSNKKKRNMKYKTVISKTKSDDVNIHFDYILSDSLGQIRQLRSMLIQFGFTNEILDILNQLDELEVEILEKMNHINTKGNPYFKK